ncbi:MAG TPA: hypothetical protein VGO62_09150, partial [Myxococcota bacterium]
MMTHHALRCCGAAVVVAALTVACATVAGARGKVIDLVVAPSADRSAPAETVERALRDAGYRVTNITSSWQRLVQHSDDLDRHFRDQAADAWPAEARAAWTSGAHACLTLAGDGENNRVGVACAERLGAAVVDAIARGNGASLLILEQKRAGDAWTGSLVEPASVDVRRSDGDAHTSPADLAVSLVRGGGQRDTRPLPALPREPSDDDPALTSARDMPFQVLPMSACVRTLPESLAVNAPLAMKSMLERAWKTLPASQRTDPPSMCSLYVQTIAPAQVSGRLACAGLVDATALLPSDEVHEATPENLAA